MKHVSIIRFCQLMAFLAFSLLPGVAQSPGTNPDNPADSALNVKPATTAVLRSVDINDGRTAGPPVSAAANGLPDAPSIGRGSDRSSSTTTLSDSGISEPTVATPPTAKRVATGSYWATTAAVFGSNIAAIELLQSCLAAGECQSIPGPMRSRGAMYGVGLPVAAGVSYLDYYLKKKEKRWWFVPAVAATAFDLFFVVHGAEK